MKRAIENAVNNILQEKFVKGYQNNLEGLTGPPCLDKSIKEVLQLSEDVKFKSGIQNINHVRMTLLPGDHFDNHVEFKYKDYQKDLDMLKQKHWSKEKLFV